MKATARDPVANPGSTQPGRQQLVSADEGVLSTGELQDRPLSLLVGGFDPTMGAYPPANCHATDDGSRSRASGRLNVPR
jgi:hypothetical protein